jgi:hypothetical protein
MGRKTVELGVKQGSEEVILVWILYGGHAGRFLGAEEWTGQISMRP